jgi:hypothetical protein
VCCFGRTGPILYSNASLLHATAARQAVEDDRTNATKLSLKPVDTAAALGSGSTARPPLPHA